MRATSAYIVIWGSDDAALRPSIDSIRSVVIHETLHALALISHSARPVSIMGRLPINKWSPRDAELLELNSHSLVRPGMTMEEVRKLVVLSDELLDAHQLESDGPPEDPLDLVWRAYALLEEAGSAIFRLSGGWTDRACNRTFGVRRSPIEMAIGEFDLFKDDPALLYMDIHTSQFYVIYSRTDEEWTHWQISPEGAWEKVDREAIWDATSWWLWNGKLHRAIRSILMGGSSEGISIEETADGNLRLSIILDESYVHMWDWTGRDSLDLTLVLDPETFALAGYTWEVHGNPDAAFGQCLTYREAATDGRLGVDIVVPEEIYSTLAGSN